MTDTAVPLPETTTEPILTIDQRRRVEALQIARRILESKPGLFVGSKIEEGRRVGDLTYLAEWILGGIEYEVNSVKSAGDLAWERRQGYVDGVKASATIVAAGGGTDDLNNLLGDDAMPETVLPTFVTPDQSALDDDLPTSGN